MHFVSDMTSHSKASLGFRRRWFFDRMRRSRDGLLDVHLVVVVVEDPFGGGGAQRGVSSMEGGKQCVWRGHPRGGSGITRHLTSHDSVT